MRHAGLAIAIALAGCHRREGELWIFPLDELRAELRIGDQNSSSGLSSSRAVYLFQPGNGGDYCRIVSPRHTRATMNGSTGEVFPGEENPFAGTSSSDVDCFDPAFGWNNGGPGLTTFVIADDSASWTFVVQDPFERGGARLISHAETETLRSGDTAVLELVSPHAMSNLRVLIRSGATVLLDVSEGNGLTRTGDEVSFVVPTIPSALDEYIGVIFDVEIPFERCDVPLGCRTFYPYSSNVRVMLAP